MRHRAMTSEHGFAIFHVRRTKVFRNSLADVREGFTVTERTGFTFGPYTSTGICSRVWSVPVSRVAAVVGGEDQNVVFTNQLHQLRQTAVEQLQTRRVASDVTTVARRSQNRRS